MPELEQRALAPVLYVPHGGGSLPLLGDPRHQELADFLTGLASELPAEDWLAETCTDATLTDTARRDRLVRWESAPHARYFHPREEHRLPLHVRAGMSERSGEIAFSGRVLGKRRPSD